MRNTSATFHRYGFTLLEVTLALAIGGLALLTATTLFLGIADREAALRAAAAQAAQRGNGEQLLEAILLNAGTPHRDARAVNGDSAQITIASWCVGKALPLAACRATAMIRDSGSRRGVWLRLEFLRGTSHADSTALELRQGSHAVFRYLIDASDGGRWTDRWNDRQPPTAIALIVDDDTLLVRVGSHD